MDVRKYNLPQVLRPSMMTIEVKRMGRVPNPRSHLSTMALSDLTILYPVLLPHVWIP
jgi:hypothetical protein